MSLGNLTTLATWVAGLTMTGVTKKYDLSNIPDAMQPMDVPALLPDVPYMSNMQFTRLSYRVATVGRSKELQYDIGYVLFYAPVAQGVTLFEQYAGMADLWGVVLNAFISNETPNGAYDIYPTGTPLFGVLADAAGTPYFAVRFTLHVQEFSS